MKDPALKKRRKRQFESLDVSTIKAIKQAVALAVWTLLMAMPDDWRVNRKWLQRELSVGEDRLAAAIARLMDLGLWQNVPTREEATGRLTGSEVWIFDEVDPPPSKGVSRNSVNPDCRGNREQLNTDIKNSGLNDDSAASSSAGAAAPESRAADAAKSTEAAAKTQDTPNPLPILPDVLVSQLDGQTADEVRQMLGKAAPDQVEAFKLSFQTAKPATTWAAWAIGMAKKAVAGKLNLPTGDQEAQRAINIAEQAAEIIKAAATGRQIFIDGQAATVGGDGWVECSGRTERLRRLLALGAQVEAKA